MTKHPFHTGTRIRDEAFLTNKHTNHAHIHFFRNGDTSRGPGRGGGAYRRTGDQSLDMATEKQDGGLTMHLTCGCDFDYQEYDQWHFGPTGDDYTVMPKFPHRRKCASCGSIIEAGAICTKFPISAAPKSDIDVRIHGDGEEGVPRAPRWLCESCSDIYFNLDALGFCVGPWDDMREMLADYQYEYGKTQSENNHEAD
jgi:hypothetical protein